MLLSPGPRGHARDEGKHHSEVVETGLLQPLQRGPLDVKNVSQPFRCNLPHALTAPAEFPSHALVHFHSDLASRKGVPGADLASWQFVKYMSSRQATQRRRRSLVLGIARDPLLLALYKLQQILAARPETQFPVKPESTRLNGFFVASSQLVGIHRNTLRARQADQTTQRLYVHPGDFTATKSVEDVKTQLHPLTQSCGLEVIDRDTVLEREPSDVGAQRQTPRRIQVPEIDGNSASQ